MADLTLNIGFNPAPNTQALLDRAVVPKGIDLKIQTRFGEGLPPLRSNSPLKPPSS